MKVLDPQIAVLTNAEVEQFLKSNTPRQADKKVGAYPSVNLTGYNTIRQDIERYTKYTTPPVGSYSHPEKWMNELIRQLKPYDLTKPEVLSLINLGIGCKRSPSATVENGTALETHGEDVDGPDAEMNVEQGDGEETSSLDRLLFSLVVEEADERFPGDQGDAQIDEILSIFNKTITSADQKTNGATNR